MTLANGLIIARSSLETTAKELSIVSRNVANGSVSGSTRKIADLATVAGGGVRLVGIARAGDDALYQKLLTASATSATQQAVTERLNGIDAVTGATSAETSPAARIGKLRDALQAYAASPDSAPAGHAALGAARDVVGALHDGSSAVQAAREAADARIARGVQALNDALTQFETVNSQVVKGSRAGRDVTGLLDQRDQLTRTISQEMGIRTASRPDHGMAIYTDSGVVLFDVKPRSVAFSASAGLPAGAAGKPVLVDGVPVTPSSSTMAISSGRIAGEAKVRDSIATTYQSQLDEAARGLIAAFAETDQSATPSLPGAAGLFSWPGGPALPSAAGIQTGLAASISINPNADPAQGGDIRRIRDGGTANPAAAGYVYNTAGGSGFSAHLQALVDGLQSARSFDPGAQLGSNASLVDYASSSVAWLEQARSSAKASSDNQAALLQHSSDAYDSSGGINLDEEMSKLLDLERSYQATSKLISVTDSMLAAIIDAVR